MTDFVHLHLHSEYSLLDGFCRISDIPKAVKALGQDTVAITDHGVMYGAVAFYEACLAEGIKPIIGCEVYMANRSRFEKSGSGESEPNHLLLLVKNEIGYRNLIAMVSLAYTEGFYRKPRVDYELLEAHSEGLIATSACLAGLIPRLIMSGDRESAEETALRLDAIFGRGNFYLELQDHHIDGQAMVNEYLAGISERTGIPLVATNDVHYLRREDAEGQAVMMCIQTGNQLSDGRPIGFSTDEFYLKSGDEMAALLGRYENAIENTRHIADCCHFDFTFGKVFLPRFTPPDGQLPIPYLKKMAYEGLAEKEASGEISYRTHPRDDYTMRIEYELLVVGSMGYAEYYLIVSDFVNHAKSKGISTGPGRGSGAGSLLAYLIGITEVDPVEYDLLFEQFLNKQRVSMPDFDIDFGDRRRDEVIAYVADKYGADHVAQIVTFGTLLAKAALRDVGRVLGMSYGEVDAVVRALPDVKGGVTLDQALGDPTFRSLYDGDIRNRNLIDMAKSLEGMPRNASTHAAGVVITDRPVSDYVPLSMNGNVPVTQFDMDTIAKLGLLKFDFLALRYLTIIEDTEREIRRIQPGFSIHHIPLDDEAVYQMITDGQTDGVFQLESAGMKQLLGSMKPVCIRDIMVAIALYRPGPMEAIPTFLKNRQRRESLSYAIPCLGPILDETCGCIVYQEQVMQIFREVAGYTYGNADLVRRAIAKKKPGVIEKERDGFIKGAVSQGYRAEDAAELYRQMVDFANYAFKKSHSAAYAFLSYRTAYLKCHYTPMYYAALISSVFGNPTKTAEYIASCAKMGIETLPPDINESQNGFSVSDGAIRFGLSAIKNVGFGFIDKVIAERSKRPYSSFYDFVSRIEPGQLNRKTIEGLIKAGCFDSLSVDRAKLLAGCSDIIDSVQAENRTGLRGQISMFPSESVRYSYPDVAPFTQFEKLKLEKESMGMMLSGSLLDEYREHIHDISPVSLSDLRRFFEEDGISQSTELLFSEKQIVTVAGIVSGVTKKITKKGDEMAFIRLDDRFGSAEVLIFPSVLTSCRKIIENEDAAIGMTAEISIKDDDIKLLAKSVFALLPNGQYAANGSNRHANQALHDADSRYLPVPNDYTETTEKPSCGNDSANRSPDVPKKLYLKVNNREDGLFRRLLALISIFGGNIPVVFYDQSDQKYYRSGMQIAPTPFVLHELSELIGDDAVILR